MFNFPSLLRAGLPADIRIVFLRMLRWLLLVVVVSGFCLGLLTRWRSPAWSWWQLAVLAGEFGHWLAAVALAAGLAGWLGRGDAPAFGGAILVVGLGVALLLLSPAWQAARLGRQLPVRLQASFPEGAAAGPAFSLPLLFLGRDPAPVPMRPLLVSPELPLDFYAPISGDVKRDPRRGAPCVIVIHGGGWDSGDRTQLPALNHWLARRGYAVAAISYRLAPAHRWPAPRDDAMAALAFLRERATELAIDPSRFVLLGRSAGGQIAEAVGYTAAASALRGIVGLYAPSDLIFGYVNTHENDMLRSPALMRQYLGGPPDTARAVYESASALYHVGPHVPPTLLLHGANDALVWDRHSVRLAARLTEHGVRHAFVHLPWATHAFDYNLHGPGGQLTRFALEWFLADVTR